MRYDNWDVILFPKDSAVPIQEFRTACYTTQDDNGHQLPTLTCYITSLPTPAPFRISIHSWITPAKPSVLIESLKRSNQKVVYTTQVVVDGTRLFHDFYEANSRWPQEILKEKRSAIEPQQPTGHFLEFPPFRQNVVMQRSWDAREHNGRIKVLLSEQLMDKNSSPGDVNAGPSNDIVCFSFQHAPLEILEQAGISWPIRNPLYLGSGIQSSQIPPPPGPHAKRHDLAAENRARSSLSQYSPSLFARPRNPEPYARPTTDPPHAMSRFPKPIMGRRLRRSGLWDSSLEDTVTGSFSGSYEDISTDSWSTKRTSPHSIVDNSMPEILYASPVFGHSGGDPWATMHPQYDFQAGVNGGGGQTQREKDSRQVVVTLRDDQLGQLSSRLQIEAMSPPKKGRERESTRQQPSIGSFTAQTTTHNQSARATGSAPSRPSAAALARKNSYQELHQKGSSKIFHNKENLPPSQFQENPRLLSGFSHAGRVPTPHPFVVPQAQMGRWDSDISMRDTSSMLSSMPRGPYSRDGKVNPIPAPTNSSGIKSRKEGIGNLDTPSHPDIRHDQSLLPQADFNTQLHNASKNTPNATLSHAHIEDIIDVDAMDGDFAPGHKGRTSSIDSTGRIERKLYSALGEELSFHGEVDAMAGVEDDKGQEMSVLEGLDVETPVIKRKRQGTLGGERDRSPIAKMAREASDDVQIVQPSDVPHVRGGE